MDADLEEWLNRGHGFTPPAPGTPSGDNGHIATVPRGPPVRRDANGLAVELKRRRAAAKEGEDAEREPIGRGHVLRRSLPVWTSVAPRSVITHAARYRVGLDDW